MRLTACGRLVTCGLLIALILAWFLTGCDDDPTSSASGSLTIVSLTAEPDTVAPSGVAVLTCVASSPDADSLRYAWSAEHGTVSGNTDTVSWTAPDSIGRYAISVTVTDGNGGSASGAVEVEVLGGTLLVKTRDGLMAIDLRGSARLLAEQIGWVEVHGTRIFVARRNIAELDHDGQVVGIWWFPGTIPFSTGFVALPDDTFAHLNSEYDRVYFMDETGMFVTPVDMPEASPDEAQVMRGLVVDNRLIISETGTGKLAAFDLDTLAASIWRDLHGMGPLGDIDHADGIYYLCQGSTLYRFSEGGEIGALCTIDGADLAGVAVAGHHAYLVASSSGTLYRVDIASGETSTMVEGLDYPQDIEYLPADL